MEAQPQSQGSVLHSAQASAQIPPSFPISPSHGAAQNGGPQMMHAGIGSVPGLHQASRKVYIGNLDPRVTEMLLSEVFIHSGPIEQCRIMRDKETGQSLGYAFMDFAFHESALVAMQTVNGRELYGRDLKVGWAHHSVQHDFTLFVGDVSAEVDDLALFKAFSIFGSCCDSRVMIDSTTKKSRGYGFVSFRVREDAELSIKEMNGKVIGSRPIRVNWATHKSTPNRSGGDVNEPVPSQQSHAQRTVYVGDLADVNEDTLRTEFQRVGMIEDVRCHFDKGFAFVIYFLPQDAARAIEQMNGKVIGSKHVKCGWGQKREKSHPQLPTSRPYILPTYPTLPLGPSSSPLLSHPNHPSHSAPPPLSSPQSPPQHISGGVAGSNGFPSPVNAPNVGGASSQYYQPQMMYPMQFGQHGYPMYSHMPYGPAASIPPYSAGWEPRESAGAGRGERRGGGGGGGGSGSVKRR